MIRSCRQPRPGYTMLEMLCVIAVIVIIGSIILPSIRGLNSDSRTKAATDLCRSRAAAARSFAVEQGRAYLLTVSPDGTKIRVAVDSSDPVAQAAEQQEVIPQTLEEELPPEVTINPNPLGTNTTRTDSNGWTILATFLPDGTCLETLVVFQINEPDVPPVNIEIRGLTGATNIVLPGTQGN